MLGGQSNFGPIGPDQFGNQGGFDLNLFDLGITDASAVQAFPQRFNRAFGVNFGSSKRNTPSFDFSDSLTWVKGKHTLNVRRQLQSDQDIFRCSKQRGRQCELRHCRR